MKSTESERDERAASRGVVPATALVLGLASAAADVSRAMLPRPGAWSRIGEVLAALAATATISLLVFTVCWLALRPLVGRGWLVRLPALGGLATFCGSAAFFGMHGAILPRGLPGPLGFRYVLVSVLAAVVAYWLLRPVPLSSPTYRPVGRLLLASPLIIFAALFLLWSSQYHGDSTWYPEIAVSVALLVAACAIALAFFLSVRAMSVLLGAVWAVTVVAGGLAIYSRTEFVIRDSERNAESTGHPVPRIILISVDTLRTDTMSVYNPRGLATPNLDALANDSIVFEKSYSGGSWTLPSVASLMTGLPVSIHGARVQRDPLPQAFDTLAETMSDAGYVTAAMVKNPLLHIRSGMTQGFGEYFHFPQPKLGDALATRLVKSLFRAKYPRHGTTYLTNLAGEWIERNRDRDFFLWLHYYAPHAPYSPPARLIPSVDPPRSIGTTFDKQKQVRAGLRLSEEERAWAKTLYLAETQLIDEEVGALIDKLADLELYDESLIVFTSDHGEEFWEHGGNEHGHSMHEEVVRVPLMIKLPGSTVTTRVDRRVANRRAMPTILEQCGIPLEDACFSRRSLKPLWLPDPTVAEDPPLILIEGAAYYEDQEALILGDRKLMRGLVSGREQLYELSTDPGEIDPLLESRLEKAREMRQVLEARHAFLGEAADCYGVGPVEPTQMDPDTIEQLRRLGYVQ